MDRFVTLPNVISVVRLLCIPLFAVMLLGDHQEVGAAYLFGALGATDWVDGFIARRFNQVSTVGKVLDPVADRLLLGVAAIALLMRHAIPWWFGAAALSREVLVGAAGIVLWLFGAARIDVRFIGKVGAFALMWSLPFFLFAHAGVSWHRGLRVAAWVWGIVGLTCSWYSAITYVPRARAALRAGR